MTVTTTIWSVTRANQPVDPVIPYEDVADCYQFVRPDFNEQAEIAAASAKTRLLQGAMKHATKAQVSYHDRAIMVHSLLSEAYRYNAKLATAKAKAAPRRVTSCIDIDDTEVVPPPQAIWERVHADAMSELMNASSHENVMARLSSMAIFQCGDQVRTYEYSTRVMDQRRRHQMEVIDHLRCTGELFLTPSQ